MARRRGMTAARAERTAKELDLYRDGVPIREIAVLVGVSHAQVHRDIRQAVEESVRPSAEALLHVELARLDKLTRAAMEAMGRLSADEVAHLPGLINAALRVTRERARLTGLDHMQHTGAEVDVMRAINEQFRLLKETPLDDLLPEGGEED